MLFEGKKYEKPEEGVHDAILADVVNLGVKTTEFEGNTKTGPWCRFVYYLSALNSEGKQFRVTEDLSVGFHKKNKLVKRLANFGVTGRGFDSDKIVGTTGRLMVVHNGDYANVSKFTPKEGIDVQVPEGFQRAPETPVAEEAA